MAFHPEPGLEVAGRYRLIRRVGGGVFGVVWEGETLDDGRPVLLELLRSEGVGLEAVSHVWRAAMLVERTSHSGAVGISDVVGAGASEDLLAIAVVPFVPGSDFDRWLRLETRTLAEAVAVIREVVDVLESAHASVDARGHAEPLVHLGLKPSEVIVGEDAYEGPRKKQMHVRILDFGLVRDHVEEDASGTMASISSPRFESPESFAFPEFEGPWSDVWSVGVMLYAVASGAYPFVAEDDKTPFQIQKHILDRPIVPLHVADERIPRAFSELVSRCLAKNPSERFEDAGELARAIDALAPLDPSLVAHPFPLSSRVKPRAGETILGAMDAMPSVATLSHRAPPPRRHVTVAGAALASLVVFGGSLGLAVVSSTSDRGRPDPAAAPMRAWLIDPQVDPAVGAPARPDPYASLVASNPFRTLPAPDAAQPLGCERDPATTGLQVEVSVARVPVRTATVARGVLAGLARSSVCDSNERRDASGRCMVLGCPPGATGPDESGRCTATRMVRGPIQRCFRRAAAKYSLNGDTGVLLQEHEVTWAELGHFVRARNEPAFVGVDPESGAIRSAVWNGEVGDARADLPAQGIPRGLAVAYCSAIGARLPTEIEFETAARGRSFGVAPWGHATVAFGTQINALGTPGALPHAVRDRASIDRTIADDPIYDLVGNVREWTSDAYAPDSPFGARSNAITDDLGASSGSSLVFGVVRGLPLATPKGWPRLARASDVQTLLPVPAAYRAPVCIDDGTSLAQGGVCLATATGYLASLRDVGFRCARGGR